MLKLTDLRKTTRRVVKDDDLRVVYPRFLRDRSLAPRIELATRYLEKMVGHARRELDQEVVAQLFGDHKLARCIIACLAASYRYDAFGETLQWNGPLAFANTYQFSSKQRVQIDPQGVFQFEGIYYYGYRFYAPHLQRWLNREIRYWK